MRANIAFTLILLILMVSSAVYLQPINAQYTGPISISADGSVAPSSAPIKQTGDIYTLESDVNNLVVERNNIIFDGNGSTVTGTISLSKVSNVTIENFYVIGTDSGIDVDSSINVTIMNNTVTGTGNGILSMDEQTAGIYVFRGNSNKITGNHLSNNYNGILFIESQNNLIVENWITNCSNPFGFSACGILFWDASNNTVYHNNFANNTAQAYDGITIFAAGGSELSSNVWDDGYPNGGNYWDDYSRRYRNSTMIDHLGIGDTSYNIDAANNDRYPLMEPSIQFDVIKTTPPKITVDSLNNKIYNDSSVPLIFSVDKTIEWIGYCLDGKQNITITSNSTLTNSARTNETVLNISNGLHRIIIYANDTFGNMGSSTVTFTVNKPEPFPTTTVIIAASALATVLGASVVILIYRKKH